MPDIQRLDTAIHNRSDFECGEPTLDEYLLRRANQEVKKRVAVCYVLVDADTPTTIIGYYTLSNCGVELTGLPDGMAKLLPRYPLIPATLLGRLAVSEKYKGQDYGEKLLLDALERAHEMSDQVGSALVVVDAISDRAVTFYQKYGFTQFPHDSMRLFMPMRTVHELFKD